MKVVDTVRRAGRSLRHAKARTLLTSLAISVGAFTVTVALAAGAGGQAYTDSLIKNNGDANSLTVFAKVDTNSDAPQPYGANSDTKQKGLLNDNDIAAIKAIKNVAQVTPAYSINVAYMTQGLPNSKKYEANVVVKNDQSTIPLEVGSLKANNQIPAGSVIIPDSYVGPLGFSSPQDALGKKVVLHIDKAASLPSVKSVESEDKSFIVVAVDKKSSTVLRYQAEIHLSPEDGKAIYEYQTAGLPQSGEYSSVNVQVASGADVKTTQQAIKNAGYSVLSLQDIQSVLFQFINVVQWGAAGFGFLAILASVFGIINTQYISVLERTQQIGLMKALGARRRDVARLFRYEAAWVGFLGGVIGTLLAVLLDTLNPWIANSLSLEKGTKLLLFRPLVSVVLIISLMIIAVAAGYFPSRKAAKLDPIEALRTE